MVAGPTATGKTGLSVRLAEALRADGLTAEIISADSRQVYRGLDIGTAKVGAEERARVPHHGLDLVDPDEPFSVADFVSHVESVLPAIARRGGLALLVGGTGLYLRAVARGLDTAALPHDATLRAGIEADLARDGPAALADRLQAIAPLRAARTDLRNPRRIVRALEIAVLRGDGPLPGARGYAGPSLWIGLDVADRDLHRRWIGERARGQFRAGLIDEARALRERYDPSLPGFSAIGYREAWAVLDETLTVEEAITLDARRNNAFARRQRTWFRAEPDIGWLDAAEDPVPLAIGRARAWLRALGVS